MELINAKAMAETVAMILKADQTTSIRPPTSPKTSINFVI